MILCTFQKGTDVIVIKVSGRSVTFNRMVGKHAMYTTIEGLQLNPSTIVEEFPDLKGKEIFEIKKEGIKRFKEHLQKMNSENDIMDYLHDDLKKHGYNFLMFQRQGWRPVRVK